MSRTIPDLTLLDKEKSSGARTIQLIRPAFLAVLCIALARLPKIAASLDPLFQAHEAGAHRATKGHRAFFRYGKYCTLDYSAYVGRDIQPVHVDVAVAAALAGTRCK